MIKHTAQWLAILGAVTMAAVTMAQAQDNTTLLNILVKKGLITTQEADQVLADIKTPPLVLPAAKNTTQLRIGGRVQMQYDNLGSNRAASSQHFLLRRIYLGVKGNVFDDWNFNFNYDFVGSTFDQATIGYATDLFGQNLNLDFGLRKVNFGFEETTSSGSLKAIERSPATRYFVEGRNASGRLGAGSYRTGVFADFNRKAMHGRESGLFYGFSVTNPERDESSAGVGSSGSNVTNVVAVWANAGYTGTFDQGSYTLGVAGGFLPDQGGAPAAFGAASNNGNNIKGYSIYGTVNVGDFTFAAEFLGSQIDRGNLAGTATASPYGFWIQPSYRITKKLEGVVRYTYLNSDGRGIKTSDAIKNGPGALADGDELDELYLGVNYYFVGNDVKLQFGYIQGHNKNSLSGAPSETIQGVRSQLQLNF